MMKVEERLKERKRAGEISLTFPVGLFIMTTVKGCEGNK